MNRGFFNANVEEKFTCPHHLYFLLSGKFHLNPSPIHSSPLDAILSHASAAVAASVVISLFCYPAQTDDGGGSRESTNELCTLLS